MGGEIQSDGEKVPKFFVWVTNDPQSGLLQRAQIVKGWMEGHESKESVYDVSCSDGSQPDTETFRCADNLVFLPFMFSSRGEGSIAHGLSVQ